MATTPYWIVPEDEDCPIQMTFQIGMIGSDGLLVASDRRQLYHQSAAPGIPASEQPTTKFKFSRSPDESVICAFAGSPFAESLADLIALNTKPREYKNHASWREHVLDVAANARQASNTADEVFVIRPSVLDNMLVVTRQGIRPATGAWLKDRVCIGMDTPSRFLPHHLWKRCSVAELRPVALLAVAFASIEYPQYVGEGIDLLTVKKGKRVWERFAPFDPDIQRAVDNFQLGAWRAFSDVPEKLSSPEFM